MQVIPCEPDHPERSPHGSFLLQPEPGWELRSFIDFTSGLLIVQETNDEWARKQRTGGMVRIPKRVHVIDSATGKVLERDEWAMYFDYSINVRTSPDGKLELTSQRIPSDEDQREHFVETLRNLETGRTIGPGLSTAFRPQRRVDSMERYLRNEVERVARQAALDAKLDAATYATRETTGLVAGDVVLHFNHGGSTKRLTVTDQGFELSIDGADGPVEHFSSLEQFWLWLNPTGVDFLECEPVAVHGALFALVVSSTNWVRSSSLLTKDRLATVNLWDRLPHHTDIHPDVYKQHCPHCGEAVKQRERYPTYLCKQCRTLETVDETGAVVTFSNVSLSGGFRVNTWRDGEIVHSSDSERRSVCFVEGRRYVATEARFGGVVIFAELD